MDYRKSVKSFFQYCFIIFSTLFIPDRMSGSKDTKSKRYMVLFAIPRDSLIKVQGDWMAITQLVRNIWDRTPSMHHERQARVCHQNKMGIRHGLAWCVRESSGQSERLPQWFENHCWRIMGEIVFPAKYWIPPAIPRSLFLPTHLLRQPFSQQRFWDFCYFCLS